MDSGVAQRPLADIKAYKAKLTSRSSNPPDHAPGVRGRAHLGARIVFAEGEDERVLRAAQAMLEETTETPILIGRPEVIEQRCERHGLEIRPTRDFKMVNPNNDPRYRDYWGTYHQIMMAARCHTRPRPRDHAHQHHRHRGCHGASRRGGRLICGTFGEFRWHLNYVTQVLGDATRDPHGALSMMILEDGPLFIADTHVYSLPTPDQLAKTAIGAARHARRFGVEPRIAFCSQSQFGNQAEGSGKRLREAIALLDRMETDFQYEGEMNVDAALDPELRERLLPGGRLEGAANVLIFGHADAASASRNMLKMKAGGLEVGPILMGMGNLAHVVTPGITARGC
jgi:malate dehydrogenase (oxaloacetate-decarboxylating)(NADP+)